MRTAMIMPMNKIEKLIEELCPEGVEFKALGEVGKVSMCKRIFKNETLSSGQIPFYKIGTFGKQPNAFISEQIFNDYRNRFSFPNKGDVLLSASGTIGRRVIYDGEPAYFQDSNIIWLEHDESTVLNKFLYHFYSIVKWQTEGGTIQRLYNDNFKKIKIPIPPLAIQQEIVKILDTFTTLEAELEAELDARKKQYEYYREELLTFGEDVEWKKLEEVGTLIRGNGLQKKDFVEDGVGCIHYGQIYTYYGTFADKTKTFVSPKLAMKLKKAQKDDVLISGVSENIEDVCKPLGWLGDEICISGDMFAFRHNQNTKFITYLLQTINFKRYKERFAHGAKVIRVKQNKILDYKIPIPPLAEQKRIVAILDKFDALVNDISDGLPAELNARRKQYEYYRNKLLTFKPLEKENAC